MQIRTTKARRANHADLVLLAMGKRQPIVSDVTRALTALLETVATLQAGGVQQKAIAVALAEVLDANMGSNA